MKNKIFLTALSILIIGSIKLDAQWALNGNATAPGNYLGTNNAMPLDFYTSGTLRMTIRGQAGPTQGFVRINEANPLSVLQVNAFAYGTGNIFRTDGISTVPNVWSMFTGASAATLSEKGAISTGGFNNTTPNDFCMRTSVTGAAGGDLVFYTQNNLERMRINMTLNKLISK